MHRSHWIGCIIVGIVGVCGGLLAWPGLSSANSDPAASPSGLASAGASAAPAGSDSLADVGPGSMPSLENPPFPEEKSPRPTAAEWKPTTPLLLKDRLPFECNAYRVREWIKIRCSKLMTAELASLSGSRDGVLLFVDPPPPGGFPASPGGEIVFPLRKGDRRVFEWSMFGESYEGVGFPTLAFMISASWAPDEPNPVIIAQM